MKAEQGRERLFWLGIGLLTAFKLWLVQGQALIANPQFPHDDLLFMRLAENLAQGDWLGPYNNLTLSKGPFYPLWIAVSYKLGVSLLISQHLLYAAACLVLILAVRPWSARAGALMAIYALLLFNPISYAWWVGNRVIRAGVYPALAMISLACAFGLAVRGGVGWRRAWPWALGLGASLAAFWLTREEGVWLLPSLCLLGLFSIGNQTLRVFMAPWTDRDLLQPHTPINNMFGKTLRVSLAGWVFALVVFALLVGAVAVQNYRHYGLLAKSEMDARPFKAAYGAILRVAPAQLKPYFAQETLRQIYAASPAFAELADYLDGEKGSIWALDGGGEDGENNFEGGVFIWALRDAIADAGYYAEGKFPAAYYRSVADEIDKACAQGRLKCFPTRASLAPPWKNAYLAPLLRNSIKAGGTLARFSGLGAWPLAAPADSPATSLFSKMSGERLYGMGEQTVVIGWALYEENDITLQVRAAGGQLAEAAIEQLASPDVHAYFMERGQDLAQAQTARFQLETACGRGCTLEALSDGVLVKSWPMDKIKAGGGAQQDAFKVYFETIKRTSDIPGQTLLGVNKEVIFRLIDRFYQWSNPILALVGLAAYGACGWGVFHRKMPLAQWVYLSALLLAAATIAVVVAYVETSAFRAIYALYLAPAYPLMLAFEGLAIGWGFETIFVRKENQNHAG